MFFCLILTHLFSQSDSLSSNGLEGLESRSGLGLGGEVIEVGCSTTKGDIVISVYPQWAPLGAERFIQLVQDDFYTG